jgi:hypothetical protein
MIRPWLKSKRSHFQKTVSGKHGSNIVLEVEMHCTNCGKENEEGNQFCMHCGTELYKPDTAPSEPEMRESQSSIHEKPEAIPEEKKAPIRDRRKTFIILGAVGAFLVLLVCIWTAVVFWGFQIFSPGEQLVYGIQEDHQDNLTVIMSISENGKDNKEIYSENDGFNSTALYLDNYPWLKNNTFSPNGEIIAIVENEGGLLLLKRDSSLPVSIDIKDKNSPVAGGYLQSFSPNGEYFGFTDKENNSFITTFIDTQGNEIYSFEDKIFGAFLPDSRRVVVYETDREYVTGLGIVDILKGEYSYLTGLDEDETDYTIWHRATSALAISSNGETIYYCDGKNLMSIPTKGGSSSIIYESDEGIWGSIFSPNNRTLAIIDIDGSNLYLYDTRRDDMLRITNDVQTIKFSPNGRYIAYLTYEGANEYDLYISKLDGSDKVRLARNSTWLKFEFSPDNKYIGYIDGNNIDDGGSLYVVRYDGSNPTRLDTGVWSFRFVDNGSSITYIKVNDLDRGNPESEIYRIRVNGRNKERLLQADDGLFTFIWPIR